MIFSEDLIEVFIGRRALQNLDDVLPMEEEVAENPIYRQRSDRSTHSFKLLL